MLTCSGGRECRLNCMGVWEHNVFVARANRFGGDHECRAMPSKPIDTSCALEHGEELQICRQPVSGSAVRRNRQARPRKLPAYFSAVRLQQLHRHGPSMLHAIIIAPLEKAAPFIAADVARFAATFSGEHIHCGAPSAPSPLSWTNKTPSLSENSKRPPPQPNVSGGAVGSRPGSGAGVKDGNARTSSSVADAVEAIQSTQSPLLGSSNASTSITRTVQPSFRSFAATISPYWRPATSRSGQMVTARPASGIQSACHAEFAAPLVVANTPMDSSASTHSSPSTTKTGACG